MNRFTRIPSTLALLAAASVVGVWLSLAGTNAPATATVAAPPRSVAADVKVHIDPVTRRIIPPPAQAVPDPTLKAQFPSSHEGLIEERVTGPAGGFKVNARGRFRSAVTLRVGPDGKRVVACMDDASETPPTE